jgi:hypothetical protein
MPANTPKGYTYPIGTDRVMDGDDAIKTLAEQIDTYIGKWAAGQVQVPVSAGTALGSTAVTFPVGRFTVAPWVTGTYNGTNISWGIINISAITTSGCTVGVSHRDGTNSGTSTSFGVSWHAVQLP